jgi:chromatin segregation and condensation protein Rec8/ScpA/Scc1 (kleisin family)
MDASTSGPAINAAGEGGGGTPRIDLPAFSGSLDLLLNLARTQQIDLARLAPVTLVEQLVIALEQAAPKFRSPRRAIGW